MTRRRQTHDTIPVGLIARLGELAASDRIERYRVVAELARGGMSTVYLGEDTQTGARVAIKALDTYYVGQSDMVLRLLGEHELASRARHPALLEVHGAAQTADGLPYLIMEYLRGDNLGAHAERHALSLTAILAVAAQVASAAAALHAAGVVHCDLKPENVLVLEEPGPGGWPRIKVIDYGVARLTDEPAATDGSVVGTPAFMPPEQWHGAPTPRSDVYALGCLLYELITGAPVFGGSLPQLMIGHCERLPERPSFRCLGRFELDPALDKLIVRMLAKDPAMRPTMADAASELLAMAPPAVRMCLQPTQPTILAAAS
ncbi:MAG TPA: serine/threonine-protein kinase [Kofleriaceae bacterium]